MGITNINLDKDDFERFVNNLNHPDREALRKGREFCSDVKIVRNEGHFCELEVPDIDIHKKCKDKGYEEEIS